MFYSLEDQMDQLSQKFSTLNFFFQNVIVKINLNSRINLIVRI